MKVNKKKMMKGGKDKGRKNKEKKLENRKYFAPMFSLK
jgi:hypothetical protein